MGSACTKNKVAVNEVIEDVKTDKTNGDITQNGEITLLEDKTSKLVEKSTKEQGKLNFSLPNIYLKMTRFTIMTSVSNSVLLLGIGLFGENLKIWSLYGF